MRAPPFLVGRRGDELRQVASTTGSDSNAGTLSAPYRSAQHLADSLSYGQTGCLRAGTFAFDDQVKVTRPGITLTSYPGERATLRGRLWVDADDVTISDLDLDGRGPFNHSEAVTAADDTFDNLDVTNYHTAICFVHGSSSGYGRAVRTVIENSRIHDCGRIPSTNQDHGIYAAAADDLVIRNNWIYDNTDRGIQLYPDSHGAHVYGNVIDGNGEGIVISGNGSTASSDNMVENNLISNSKIRWNVESNWPNGLVGSGNVVRNNCLWSTNTSGYYNQNGGVLPSSEGAAGFSASGNVIADPHFADPSASDFQVASDRPCANVGRGETPPITTSPPPDGTGSGDSSEPGRGAADGSVPTGQGSEQPTGGERRHVTLRAARATVPVGGVVNCSARRRPVPR